MPPEAMRSSLRFFFSPSWRAMRRRERRTQSDKSSASSRLPAHKGYETDLQPDRWGWRVGEAHKNFFFFNGKKNYGVMTGRWFSPIAVNFAKKYYLVYFILEDKHNFFSSSQRERRGQEKNTGGKEELKRRGNIYCVPQTELSIVLLACWASFFSTHNLVTLKRSKIRKERNRNRKNGNKKEKAEK